MRPEHPAEGQGLSGAWYYDVKSAWAVSVDFREDPGAGMTASIKFIPAMGIGQDQASKRSVFLNESDAETHYSYFKFQLNNGGKLSSDRLEALAKEAQKEYDRTGDERYEKIVEAVDHEQAKRSESKSPSKNEKGDSKQGSDKTQKDSQ